MPRPHLRYLVAAIALGLMSGAVPALAAGRDASAEPASVDARALAGSKVVETVEIGLLGRSDPLVVEKRTLRGKRMDAGRLFDVAARQASIQSHRESCYWGRPTWKRYNGFGKLSSKAWYYMEWCGANGKVTRVLTLYCGGVGAQGFSYGGCRIRRGSTGYSRVNVSGTWKFPFKVGFYTILTRTVTVKARHYATGRYAGTWWMYQ